MADRVLNTMSKENLLESMSKLLNCSETSIEVFAYDLRNINRNTNVDDINLNNFFNFVGIDVSNRNRLFKLVRFDSIIVSHLTSRIENVEFCKEPLLNLFDALSSETQLSKFFKFEGFKFIKKGKKLITIYNGQEIDWEKLRDYGDINSNIAMIKRRLLGGRYDADRCVNGFLFNDYIWEDGNVKHIIKCPEIMQDICYVLGRQDIVKKWIEKAKTHVICFKAKIRDIVIDNRTNYRTEKSKVYYFYRQALYYIAMKKWGFWDPRFHNPIIRLKDNLNVSAENIVSCYYIE